MRRATALDIKAAPDHSKTIRNGDYTEVILLSRVVTELGSSNVINTRVIKNLYTIGFAYLIDMYKRLNDEGE